MSKKLEEVIGHAIEKAGTVALVEVRDTEIIVTVPGTDYGVTYYKPANSPQLLVKNFPRDDKHASITRSEFLALALRLLTIGHASSAGSYRRNSAAELNFGLGGTPSWPSRYLKCVPVLV
jgi:hypothetical protein